ncbi:RecQ family ATP-dependent DNA helicase [Actinoplanes sp. NPDC020271]|uniref:RecQ family ATP-dependent DNA helicase n=1 Tax=Actinoplanes sp. NPDC020271 TaxID=3363896 RepID=UPI0037AA01CB
MADLVAAEARRPEVLEGILRDQGIVMPVARLLRLPERFPACFTLDDDGRLSPVVPEAEVVGDPGSFEPEQPAWFQVPMADPLGIDDLVAVHGDAAARLADGVCGSFHQVGVDDRIGVVTFGEVADRSSGVRLDLRLLALLEDPTRPADTLGELCEALGMAAPGPGSMEQATAVANCLQLIWKKIDLSDPSWSLARGCMAAAGNDWAMILSETPLPAAPADGLACRDDPLLVPISGEQPYRTSGEAVRAGLEKMRELGYADRAPQQEMARAVADVLDAGGLLAIEAPTGTGKSLAYLSAAAGRAGTGERPVVVATATKVLQHQLRRDAERMQRQGLFHAPFRQLFGVGNYICTREVASALAAPGPGSGPMHWLALAVAVRALAVSATGVWDDVADTDVVRGSAEYRGTRDTLRTDAASCERRACPYVDECPLFRRLAGMGERPGVVAVNHALIAAWAKLAQEGIRTPGDVLADGVSDLVFDEAHELEDSLTNAWTSQVGERDLAALAARVDSRFGLDRHLRSLARRGADLRGGGKLAGLARRLRQDTELLAGTVAGYLHEYGGPGRSAVLRRGLVQTRPEYGRLAQQARTVQRSLGQLGAELTALETAVRAMQERNSQVPRALMAGVLTRVSGLLRAVDQADEVLGRLHDLPDEHLWVYQLRAETDWLFESVPIDVGSAFATGIVQKARSVTLTSATLTVGETFDFIGARLGVRVEPGSSAPGVFDGRRLRSPFDHAQQSAVVLTNHLPMPIPAQEREFTEDLARDQVGLLSLTGGRAMTLFAARQRMTAVAERVARHADDLAARGVRILVQGEVGPAEIGRRFRAEPGTVVYGLRTYWQGFDAPGETLSYLVIEKPPYPHPGDAVVAARVRAVADRGGDPFLEYLVPKTAVLLAQGFGRLIRTEADRGVALICDRRMQSPGAANRMLLSTLPGPRLHLAEDRDDAWRFALRFVTGADPDLTTALQADGDDRSAELARLRLIPGEDPEPKLREAARVIFGVEELRESQLRLMLAHLAGADTVGILPTGTGKSLCFQLPAMLRAENRATVVVSPLVALIKDQLDGLRGRLGLRGVQGITGTTPSSVRSEILRDLAAGKVRLLYVSPERLVRDPVLHRALQRQDLAGLVVDEAHCVSDWGHDFRPEFRRVSQAVAHLGRAPRMALTATATPPVAQDIISALEMTEPVTVSLPSDRPNLSLRVVQVAGERERARELLRIAVAMKGAPGIVYASRRSITEEIAALLRRAGLTARHYHAGMVPEQREVVQEDFLAGTTQVIVATKAFGMGVDKPDIAWVVHFDLPESLDAYVQEAGRAARSPGLTGECVLLHTARDAGRRRRRLTDTGAGQRLDRLRTVLRLLESGPRRGGDVVFDPDALAETVGVEPDELNVLLAWLERTGTLVQLPDCSARGTVHIGVREPADLDERIRFRETALLLNLRPEVGSRIDFERLGEQHGADPDRLEQDLVAWSLDRFLTFSSTRRHRRVRLLAARVNEPALRREIERWSRWQHAQLDAVIAYTGAGTCRRAEVIGYFGFPATACGVGQQACDNCGGRSFWQDLPASAVPDPEQLINVDLTVLQAVAWASGLRTGRYGAGGLKAAVLGAGTIGNRPLGDGLRRCPQFGALRHVRAAERRFDEAVSALGAAGYLETVQAQRDGMTYTSLAVTAAGRERLGMQHG